MRMRLSTLVAGLIVGLLLALTCEAAQAQVIPEVTLDRSTGYARQMVRNTSPDSVAVTIELHRGEVIDGRVVLGDVVAAVISPRAFRLASGETQTVRLVVDIQREAIAVGEVLRLVTTFDPILPPPEPTEAVTARVLTRLRVVSKVVAQ